MNIQSSLIAQSRNMIAKNVSQANDEKHMDYLFWIDSDMQFPPDTLVRLLSHDKDVAGAFYRQRLESHALMGRLKGPRPEVQPTDSLHEAEMMPGGLVLVKADVYRKLPYPWYAVCFRYPGDNNLEAFKSLLKNYYGSMPPNDVLASIDNTPLGDWISQHGDDDHVLGEDYFFCRYIRKHGYQIWCDLSLTYQIAHIGSMDITMTYPPWGSQ